ncbi:gamma-glutamylcyclotransferase family protein [Nocardia sp. NPDC052566]|uniref:gamma-glutamylcyclotransferase family protein n=1 Tax=Nocardia sp. NPDC052566 TaxID=3364330 RepID=UPI0037C8E969
MTADYGDARGGRLARLRDAGPGQPLFAYGTLQFPQVLLGLLGRCPALEPAELPGWRSAVLPGLLYPGLVPAPDSIARGVLLSGLSEGEWAVLDAFEDDEYDLRTVRLADGPASTYVWTGAVAPNDWSAQRFTAEHLTTFAARSAHWRARLGPQ